MAYKLDIYGLDGKKKKEIELNEQIFNEANVNESLIHEYLLYQLANARLPIAHAKTRSEVNYSGRKLHRQKGLGMARVGDAGSPIRKKGGVAFGPRNDRNWTKKMPKKMRRKALFGILTKKLLDKELKGIESFALPEVKTKEAHKALENLKLEGAKVLLVYATRWDWQRAFRNLPNADFVSVDNLNPHALLSHKMVLLEEWALDKLVEVYLK